MKTSTGAFALILGVAVVGCDKEAEKKAEPASTAAEPAKTASAAPAATPAPTPSAAPAASASAAPAANVDEKGVPEIPSDKSNPPSVDEWKAGVVVNTQGAGNRAKDCELRVVREWLQVMCTGEIVGYEKMKDFGPKLSDYYESIKLGKSASFVLRLKKGKNPAVRVCRKDSFASLFVSWPGAKDRPANIAMAEIQKKCDGNDYKP